MEVDERDCLLGHVDAVLAFLSSLLGTSLLTHARPWGIHGLTVHIRAVQIKHLELTYSSDVEVLEQWCCASASLVVGTEACLW